MATAVKLSESIILEANPDLNYEFIKNILIAQKESKSDNLTIYNFNDI